MEKYLIHTDGGSRGNPGPGALGAVIESTDGVIKKEYGEFLGIVTNNEAEYQAVIFALKKLKQLIGSEQCKKASIELYTDSELLVKQINGQYKITDKNLQERFMEVWNLRLDFGKVEFIHVYREDNKDADRMVNRALDRQTSAGKLDV